MALKALVALFPFLPEYGFGICPGIYTSDRDDIQYDFNHLQLLGAPGCIRSTKWHLLPLSDLPRTRLVIQGREVNATAALNVIQNIDSYCLTYPINWTISRLSFNDRTRRTHDAFEQLAMLLNQAAYSFDLIITLPFHSVGIFDKYSYHTSWCAVKVAVKSYLNRHGIFPVKSGSGIGSSSFLLRLFLISIAQKQALRRVLRRVMQTLQLGTR